MKYQHEKSRQWIIKIENKVKVQLISKDNKNNGDNRNNRDNGKPQ